MSSFRREVLVLVVVLGTLALLAATRGRANNDDQAPQHDRIFPRVAVDGVSAGDSLDAVKVAWGEFTQEPVLGELFLKPQRQPAPHGVDLLGRRHARARGASVTEVQGRSLSINGKPVLRVGDNMDKVRELFGEPEPGIVLKRGGCGNPGPMKRWSYRRHGVILSFVVPNQSFWREEFEAQAKANPGIKVSFEDIIRKEPLLHEVQNISVHLRALD